MWATTKSNQTKYHAVYERNGEQTAVCNKSVKVPLNTKTREAAEELSLREVPGIRKRGKSAELCARCVAKAGRAENNSATAESVPESLPEPDPTGLALKAAGYSSDEYNTLTLIPIIRGWLSEDVDVFGDSELLSLIASKHKIGA